MKNVPYTIILLVVIYLAILFFEGGIKLTEQKKVDKELIEAFSKSLGDEVIVYHISLTTKDPFSYKATGGVIYYCEPGSDTVKGARVDFNDKDTERRIRELISKPYAYRTPDTGIALKDLDVSRIAENIKGAVDVLRENDIRTAGVSDYRIEITSSDPAGVHHVFCLNEKGKKKTQGRKVITDYYQYTFSSTSEGWLTLLGDDEE